MSQWDDVLPGTIWSSALPGWAVTLQTLLSVGSILFLQRA